MKPRMSGKKANGPEVPPVAAGASRHLNQVGRYPRILVETAKKVMGAQRDKIPPARDPLAP
jgi:hypothetical protein